jgi:hypothetical protein
MWDIPLEANMRVKRHGISLRSGGISLILVGCPTGSFLRSSGISHPSIRLRDLPQEKGTFEWDPMTHRGVDVWDIPHCMEPIKR